ncbi:hypothetical protein XH89_00930 [Bradyrhizobium sp. CCBAU 53340]|uniref:hypothetical protein n=1 Tax=Bradyrhizobium sp. CCBAU 53340 TaxID=1325112 RepID=UPI00188CC39A|nr:hypothetical protein [Bradyrhizobium sp. CCBAU 53340]QOZ42188.1 hypothetical protein XH89_00930 [Bradyrhizobium sp. CCBAU 53340]
MKKLLISLCMMTVMTWAATAAKADGMMCNFGGGAVMREGTMFLGDGARAGVFGMFYKVSNAALASAGALVAVAETPRNSLYLLYFPRSASAVVIALTDKVAFAVATGGDCGAGLPQRTVSSASPKEIPGDVLRFLNLLGMKCTVPEPMRNTGFAGVESGTVVTTDGRDYDLRLLRDIPAPVVADSAPYAEARGTGHSINVFFTGAGTLLVKTTPGHDSTLRKMIARTVDNAKIDINEREDGGHLAMCQ